MEKSLVRISGVIAIIMGALWCLGIITILIGVPIIIGGILMTSYANLSDEEFKDKKVSILGWSIFFLFFTLIGGVLGLIAYVLMEKENFVKESKPTTYIDEIKELDRLRKNGLITDKEYEAKKKKILDI